MIPKEIILARRMREIREEKEALELEEQAIKADMYESIKGIEGRNFSTSYGTFTIVAGRKTYAYSDAVSKLKKVEEDKGIATCKQGKEFVTFSEAVLKTDDESNH